MRLFLSLLLAACVGACDSGSPVQPSNQTPTVAPGDSSVTFNNITVEFGPKGAPRPFSATPYNSLSESLEGLLLDPEGTPLPDASVRYNLGSAPGFNSVAGSSLEFQYVLGVRERNGMRTAWDAAWSGDVDQGMASLDGGFAESGSIEFIATQLFIAIFLLPQLDGTLDAELIVESNAASDFTARDVVLKIGTFEFNFGPILPRTQQSLSRVVENVTASSIELTIDNPGLSGGEVDFVSQQAKGEFFYRLARQPVVLDVGFDNEDLSSWDRSMFNSSHPGNQLAPDELAFNLSSGNRWSYVRAGPSGLADVQSRNTPGQTIGTTYTGYVPGSSWGTRASLQQTQVFQAIVAGGEWGLSIANYDNTQQVFGPDVVVETNSITDVSQQAGDPATGVLVYVDNTADEIKFVERNAQNEYATVPSKTLTNAAWPGASGKVVSAVQKADGSLLFITDGAPGELWFLASGAATATKVSDVGDAPRRVRCAGNIAVVSNFGGFGGLSFFVNIGGTWDSAPFSLAAQRSIGIDAKVLPSGNVAIASAGFFNHTLRVTTLDNTDGTILDDQSLDLPAQCLNPGHAAWVRDDVVDHRVLVSCNGSDNVAIMPTAPE